MIFLADWSGLASDSRQNRTPAPRREPDCQAKARRRTAQPARQKREQLKQGAGHNRRRRWKSRLPLLPSTPRFRPVADLSRRCIVGRGSNPRRLRSTDAVGTLGPLSSAAVPDYRLWLADQSARTQRRQHVATPLRRGTGSFPDRAYAAEPSMGRRAAFGAVSGDGETGRSRVHRGFCRSGVFSQSGPRCRR